ncbi:4'-phosphopantetheinyl transferase superfamily protein [Streptomyces sp. ML-6]|uniref:4'-phosphopantetheinyl transferase family protein n=1 Tax=Streptomyces sp. ML-6 TaxID=2982693 RepID=UPI0024BF9C16|nr:4'-phosphopantetheinyl transferase superfamily protein [Streptomyces sp. ML-6]MDK0522797.1 4'-phosphopantetheinyl transferase superfamily protein [Streptomyces sp. ML-6]
MIEKILPSGVAVAEVFSDLPDAVLMPAEEELVHRYVEKRRLEFTTTRHCARRALGELGIAPVPILKGERGAPVWPQGVVGSMTHCVGYRAAVVARDADVLTIGIDAEHNAPLPDDVHDNIALTTEQEREHELRRRNPGIHWDRLLFSAKESVYKAWFPLTRRWLGFEEADIVLHPDGGFTAEILASRTAARSGTNPRAPFGEVPEPSAGPAEDPSEFRGRWLAADGLLVTAIVVAEPAA